MNAKLSSTSRIPAMGMRTSSSVITGSASPPRSPRRRLRLRNRSRCGARRGLRSRRHHGHPGPAVGPPGRRAAPLILALLGSLTAARLVIAPAIAPPPVAALAVAAGWLPPRCARWASPCWASGRAGRRCAGRHRAGRRRPGPRRQRRRARHPPLYPARPSPGARRSAGCQLRRRRHPPVARPLALPGWKRRDRCPPPGRAEWICLVPWRPAHGGEARRLPQTRPAGLNCRIPHPGGWRAERPSGRLACPELPPRAGSCASGRSR
jgi:hypothetical protein